MAAAGYRLARAGYVLTFEVVGDQLWCRSCDVSLPVGRFSVDASVVVGRSGGKAVRLLAIHSDSPPLRGTWLVGTSAREVRLVHRLVRQGAEPPTLGARLAGTVSPRAVAGVPAAARRRTAPASVGERGGGRLLTVTW